MGGARYPQQFASTILTANARDVDEHDVAGMSDAMMRLIDDPALAARLGGAARDHITTHFSNERSLDRLWTIIASCF